MPYGNVKNILRCMPKMGLLWWPVSDGKESACSAGDPGLTLGWEGPLEEEMQPTPVFLPGEFHGQSSLAGYRPWRERVRQNLVTNTLHLLCYAKAKHCRWGVRKRGQTWPLVFVNKALLEHSHTHLLLDCLWMFSHYKNTVEWL